MSSYVKPTEANAEVFERLEAELGTCMIADRHRLHRQARRLRAALQRGTHGVTASALESLAADIRRSCERLELRRQAVPQVSFPKELPITARREDIARALNSNQVVIVCGETGSGKSTQLPKLCLSLGRGVAGMIGHTQPRRIAARTVAARVAEELGTPLGQAVGYKVRFSDHANPQTHIKLMTDGILLAEAQSDRFLEAYDTLIIDEAHERSLNIDFLLGYLRKLLPKRPELKLIVTSATIDPERFSRHFGGAPVIEVSGRMYPVEIRYQPPDSADENERDLDLQEAVVRGVQELSRSDRGDILVFLPGEREIRETAEALRKRHPPETDILPLYARLSAAEQNRVFQPHGRRHIVLATNVAETSLTVPGIRYVIDTGLARISRYDPRRKVQRLRIERISRASAAQRAGRCGRVAEGVCLRLYPEQDFEDRPAFTDPEIRRTSLASVILRLGALRFGRIEQFTFVDPPEQRYINDGYKLLHELGAVDESNRLTELGRRLARLPVDPRLGRMLLAGCEEDCLSETLVIVSALSVQDPRERPAGAEEKADEAHAQFRDDRSDFLWYLNLWRFYQERIHHLSANKLRKLCASLFLSYMRMREWLDIHSQLRGLMHDMGYTTNCEEVRYESVHRALLNGLLGNIGFRGENTEYAGARGVKFRIFPGSALFKQGPKWVMAAELAETTRLYARGVARIEPEWVLKAGAHLLKRSYSDPHWERKGARVIAFEKVTLYGLTIVPRQRVAYARIDPVESRRLFLRALVDGDFDSGEEFQRHNRDLIEEVRALEHRARRLDILVDENEIFDFFDARIPAPVNSGRSFLSWYRRARRDDPNVLHFSREMLIRGDASEVTSELYPETITVKGVELALEYLFDPRSEDDGVTVRVPLAILNQLSPPAFEWLVPGLLPEKVTALIRSLPKALRRNFVPAPDYARSALARLKNRQEPLREALGRELERMSGIELPADAWRLETLDAYLFFNFRVLDAKGVTVGKGRDLEALQRRLGGLAQTQFSEGRHWEIERSGLTRWDFESLPAVVESQQQGLVLKGYPALVDQGSSVAIRVFESPAEAARAQRAGLRRLFMLELPQQIKHLRQSLPGFDRMALHYAKIAGAEQLRRDLVEASVDRAFIGEQEDIRERTAFRQCREQGRAQLVEVAEALCALIGKTLERHHSIQRTLGGRIAPAWIEAVADIREQLQWLVYPGFVTATPWVWLQHYPRYLKAVERRLEKLAMDPARDRRKAAPVLALWRACRQRLGTPGAAGIGRELLELRWLLEEFRVSQFAQDLGTAQPVSDVRLRERLSGIDLR